MELTPTEASTLVNPINVAGELAFKGLSMAKFGNRELPGNLSPSPPSLCPSIASSKQRGVRGGWKSRDGNLPCLLQINDGEHAGG